MLLELLAREDVRIDVGTNALVPDDRSDIQIDQLDHDAGVEVGYFGYAFVNFNLNMGHGGTSLVQVCERANTRIQDVHLVTAFEYRGAYP